MLIFQIIRAVASFASNVKYSFLFTITWNHSSFPVQVQNFLLDKHVFIVLKLRYRCVMQTQAGFTPHWYISISRFFRARCYRNHSTERGRITSWTNNYCFNLTNYEGDWSRSKWSVYWLWDHGIYLGTTFPFTRRAYVIEIFKSYAYSFYYFGLSIHDRFLFPVYQDNIKFCKGIWRQGLVIVPVGTCFFVFFLPFDLLFVKFLNNPECHLYNHYFSKSKEFA